MTTLEALTFALASGIIVTAGIAALYARLFGRPMRQMLIWAIITAMASAEVLGMCSAIRPCEESDQMRRCDLEAPNPVKMGCGLLVQPFRHC